MKKWVIFIIFILIGIVVYNYIYQDHRNISEEKSQFIILAKSIASEFSSNYKTAESKYLNKTIEVSGEISEITDKTITINDKVFCSFTENISTTLKVKDKIKIKGRCIGYDDLLEQVKLDQCILSNNKKNKKL